MHSTVNNSQQAREILLQQYQVLLEISESIAAHRDLAELFHDLAERLRQVVSFEQMRLILHDSERNVMRVHLLAVSNPSDAGLGCQELPVEDSPGGWAWQTQQPLVVSNTERETRFPRVTAFMRQQGVKSFCVVPLTTAQRRLGALGFGSLHQAAYDDADQDFLQQVAKQVAVAVDNTLNYQQIQSYQQTLANQRDRLRLLLEVNNAMVSHLDIVPLMQTVSTILRQVVPHDSSILALYDPDYHQVRVAVLDFPGREHFLEPDALLPIEGTPLEVIFRSRQPLLMTHFDLAAFPADLTLRRLVAEGMQSGCGVPLITHDRILGVLGVISRRPAAFTREDQDLLTEVAKQISLAVDNSLAYHQIAVLKDRLSDEKLYLEEEIRTEYNFEEIIGDSVLLKRVLKQVETVAPTDATVLIQGETGTGKELLARAIHYLSGRRERTFVKINCAAIPTGLLESELFGHERGAFTGAIARKIGRFELAHQGTLFLDEVGDIPLDMQAKLLRVLQEQEFERLGSTRTLRVDVRLVAATNRDLSEWVADDRFRSDLYYRLNVFPITVPPLRDRPEDIPILIRYFAQRYARRMNKRIETVPAETLTTLSRYHWPGNVRELENLIERSVILSHGPTLQVPLGELKAPPTAAANGPATLAAAERAHILHALRETQWVIGGPNGAAAYLGLKRTTLQSRMKKLGISRRA